MICQQRKLESILNNLVRIADLPRHLISDGYDDGLALIEKIAKKKGLTFKVHSYPTGYDCGTWIIPEKWTLIRAQLKDTRGNVLIDTEEEPLACISYSLPFEGKVSRDELFRHLHTCSYCPDAVPFIFKYYKRDWGLCCSENLKHRLTEDEYIVSIKTELSEGHLKVGEIIVEGEFDESFVIASHLCHPHMVNDGPIGIFPTMEILASLQERHPHYTFRQLIVPENIGSAAWLSSNQELIPTIKGGLFVEMLGTDLPLRLHRSFRGNTLVDQLFEDVICANDAEAVIDEFVHANDERQFNGPGVDVPMLGLNRSLMSREQKSLAVFPNYHTSFDSIDEINIQNYAESIKVLEKLIQAFDLYSVKPSPNFRGEPFLNRYGAHIDVFEGIDNLSKSNMMMDVLFMCGQELTIYGIGKHLGLPVEKVRSILDRFEKIKLISYKPL